MLTNIFPAAARTATVTSDVYDASGNVGRQSRLATSPDLRLYLDVTAVAGTSPTLEIIVEDSPDGTDWHEVARMPVATAAGNTDYDVTAPFGEIVRFRAVIGGTTPSFTFRLDAQHD